MSYRDVKDRHQYFREAIYEIEEWILKNPRSQFGGGFSAPGPKPPKEAFLIAAQKLRDGISKDDFMVGADCRVKLIPYNKNWELVNVVVQIDILAPEEIVDDGYEERRARFFAEDTIRRYWNND